MRKRGLYWQARPKAGGKLGKWRSTRCTDLKAAQAVLGEWERSLADPNYAAKEGATLDQAGAALMRNLASMVRVGKRSEATQGYYEQKLGTLASVMGGDALLCEITPGRVDSFINVRRLDEVTEHTIAKELGVLRVLLKTAKRNGWWAGDIDAILPHAFGTQAKPRERFLSSMAELGRILRAVHSQDIAAQIAFSVATGAEAQAIRRAQWADLAERFVAIHGKKRPSRERVVPVVASWQATLLLFVRQNSLSDRERGNPALFVHTRGIPKALRLACTKLGLPHLCPNDLRRTFNVWMDAAGVPVALRAQAMGHSSTRILDKFTYGKLPPDTLRSRMMATFRPNQDRPKDLPNEKAGSTPAWRRGVRERQVADDGGSLPLHASTVGASEPRFGRQTKGCEPRAEQGETPGPTPLVQVRSVSCQSGVTDGSALNRTEPDDSTPAANDLTLEMAPRAGIEPATYGLTGPRATEGKGS